MRAPDGVEWHVGRRWLPWRLRRREVDGPDTGGLDVGGADDLLGVIVLIFVALVAVVLLFTFVLPIVVMGLELILLLLVAFWGVGSRVVLRRPWTIQARASDGRTLEWRAKGFLRSGRVRDEAAEALGRGEREPRPAEALPG